MREAAWPLIRDDLHLSYTQVGLVLSVPPIVGHLVEPLLGVLGDVWRRRALVLAGGVAYAAGTLLVGLSPSFALLLAASILSNPSSGAFLGLSQATLMDAAPERREQNMARWALVGSIGNSAGFAPRRILSTKSATRRRPARTSRPYAINPPAATQSRLL